MPRDLRAMRDSVLNASSNQEPKDKISRDMDKQDHLNDIKPYSQSLTPSNVASCLALEEATFPPQERCTKEKFMYRFSKCGELSLGLFTSANTAKPTSAIASAPTASAANFVYSGAPDRKSILLAHCVVTKSTNATIHDQDMALPPDWEKKGTIPSSSSDDDPPLGHRDDGRTICIHSLAVLPDYQGQGLGSTLMKAYIQRMEGSGVADRIALLAHDSLIKFYEKLGFENKGPSKATFGGGGWVDMVYELK